LAAPGKKLDLSEWVELFTLLSASTII